MAKIWPTKFKITRLKKTICSAFNLLKFGHDMSDPDIRSLFSIGRRIFLLANVNKSLLFCRQIGYKSGYWDI